MSKEQNDQQFEFQKEEGKTYTQFEFTAESGQQALRIDKFLVNFIQGASRNRIQQAITNGQVLVNGQVVKSNYKVRAGDHVKVMVDEEPDTFEVIPEDIPLDVLYEDDDVMVVNKPAGMVVHPGVGNKSGTLLNALAYRFGVDIDFEGKRPWLVHRIDKNTSGLLVIAKNDTAMQQLSAQFKKHSIKRKYLALVWGAFEEPEGTVDARIMRDVHNRQKYTATSDPEKGKHAVTHYRVLEDYHFTSLVECQLETGRTHQIRVHMKAMGHPLFNDDKYGGDRILKGVVFSKYKQFIDNSFQLLPRQALHAQTLGFKHPRSGELVEFSADPPEDFQALLDKWRKMAENQNFD